MDYISIICAFLSGGLVYRLFLDEGGPGPFEKTIWMGLNDGKRVIMSIDNEAFIFEMHENRLRIRQGITDYDDGILADDVVSSSVTESTDSSETNIPDVENK